MSEVWTVSYTVPYEGKHLLHVFSTEEKAKAYVFKQLIQDYNDAHFVPSMKEHLDSCGIKYDIEQWEVQ